MQVRDLTRAEEEIMKVLWKLDRAFVKDVLAELPDDPKPAYNTVSTIIRILEKKGLVGYQAFGKTHQYYPLITEEQYKRHQTEQLMTNYFDNSLQKLVSFFVKDRNLSLKEANDLIELLNRKKEQ